MKTVNIHEAKTQLSKLVEEASKGESFVIAKAGKPVVRVTALSAPTGAQVRRVAFKAGPVACPHAVAIDSLPPIHKDPFDRILVAQATVEGVTLLTIDSVVSQYPGPIRAV